MGSSSSRLHKVVELELLQITRFDSLELQNWYHTFKKKYPSGLISRDLFIKENLSFTKFGDNELWGHIFDVIDNDRNGSISFVEWCSLLSLVNRGSRPEQLKLMFKLYDLDGDGYLEREEILQIVSFLCKVKDDLCDPEELTDQAFYELDSNNDEKISYQEFVTGMENENPVSESLNFFNTLFKGYKQVEQV
eukprot:TRINITY_DN104534_c0_g1_i1.p1 TRINITY_DN104534_c0_g1~~TRINITY_DN104534_c0_g1_i1.p1  ORF type:complete len:206 (+),score=19.09 TRINITY_DN104534_c0_g1_i1:44-619(+)